MTLNIIIKVSQICLIAVAAGAAGCGSTARSTGFEIAAATGGSLTAVAGDALALHVVEGFSDGSQQALPGGAVVTWKAPATAAALDRASTADSPIPDPGPAPTAVFVSNSLRPQHGSDLDGVVFVLDPGTAAGGSVSVTATISGAVTAMVSATISVAPAPTGNAGRGATLYAAACAGCHGATGDGSPVNPDGTTYTLAGTKYNYPAPGLNTADGNLASDPDWNAANFAMASRADIDNAGLVLRTPMPDWLIAPVSGHVLATQDFADIFAFLKTK